MTDDQDVTLRSILRSARQFVIDWDKKDGIKNRIANDDDLGGYCGFASGRLLHEMVENHFIGAEAIVGPGHVWVLYDGYILDTTACQFGEAKTVIRKLNEELPVVGKEHQWTLKHPVVRAFSWKDLEEKLIKIGWGVATVYHGPETVQKLQALKGEQA